MWGGATLFLDILDLEVDTRPPPPRADQQQSPQHCKKSAFSRDTQQKVVSSSII